MKPIVGPGLAWQCVVISTFAILILTVLGILFGQEHEALVGGTNDPDPDRAPEIAHTLYLAAFIYAGFIVCCGFQGLLHIRESRRGAITL